MFYGVYFSQLIPLTLASSQVSVFNNRTTIWNHGLSRNLMGGIGANIDSELPKWFRSDIKDGRHRPF